jgi:membrane AbrB-like protein
LGLRGRTPALRWLVLVSATLLFVTALALAHLPAAVFLGSMAAAILVAANDGQVRFPRWLYFAAQGFVGCLVARSIRPEIGPVIVRQWPVFALGILAVIVFSTALGIALARLRILPGSTAIWGSSPGAATVMMLMAEAFGGDVRLVAFMQFLRVVLVALAASVVARLWVHGGGTPPATVWFPTLAAQPFAATVALALGGAALGTGMKIPAGALLVPFFAGMALSGTHVLTITLPPWLLACCYTVIGWAIGQRFTRDIVVYAARVFPRVLASTLALLVLCGGLAWVLHVGAGIDPLTAYLATSPGGADSIAIIAASANVDVAFVMAMQTSRFLIVLLVGPTIARFVGRRFAR